MCCTVGSENLPPFKRQHLDLQVMHFTVSGGPYLRPKRVGKKWRGWAHNFHHHFRIVSILWSVDKIKSHFVGGQKFNRTIFHLFCSINSCVFCTKIYQCILRFAYICHLVELHTQWHDGLLVTLQAKEKNNKKKNGTVETTTWTIIFTTFCQKVECTVVAHFVAEIHL